jgi:hypothetical protein
VQHAPALLHQGWTLGRRWQRPRQQQKGGRQGRGVPGGPQLLHDLRRIGDEHLGSAPQAGASGGLLGKGSSAGLPRLVRQAHHLRPRRPPRLHTEPRKVPARRRPCHRQHWAHQGPHGRRQQPQHHLRRDPRALGGRSVHDPADATPFHGFVPGKRVQPLGQLDLPVCFGTPSNF